MISSKSKNKHIKPAGPDGKRAYAIGDIHGCLNQTKVLLEEIKAHNDYRDEAETYVIFLGDLVDRGPSSREVLSFLLNFPYQFAKPLFVMGNHEEMMVRGLTDEPELLPKWLQFGGYACAESYGIPRKSLMGQDPIALQHILRSAIPRKHIEFIADFLDYVHFGDFLFTHAGIRPGIPLQEQLSKDLRWIRDPFLQFEGSHGVLVVHGHTISESIEVKTNRIGLDTGAYDSGTLSAMCVDGSEVFFFGVDNAQ